MFQQDHGLPKPTSQWRPGEVIVDGPHVLRVSDRFDSYDLTVGLYKGARVHLKGVSTGGDRVLVARLKVERQAGRITNVTAEKIAPDTTVATGKSGAPGKADFTAHTNPSGTWVDLGKVATDGALKIQLEPDRLVILPYPREKPFRASLDLKALAPTADPKRVAVRALAAGTQADLGPVAARMEAGRLLLTFGTPGAGRYRVTWK